jgi:hypothetical protein
MDTGKTVNDIQNEGIGNGGFYPTKDKPNSNPALAYAATAQLNIGGKQENQNNLTELTTILKDKYTLTYSDYEKLKISEQYNKLFVQSERENKRREREKKDKRIYNLSLKEIVENGSTTYSNIINDLVVFFTKPEDQKDWNEFAYIFVRDDNMLYLGILLVVIAFALWLIDTTT